MEKSHILKAFFRKHHRTYLQKQLVQVFPGNTHIREDADTSKERRIYRRRKTGNEIGKQHPEIFLSDPENGFGSDHRDETKTAGNRTRI